MSKMTDREKFEAWFEERTGWDVLEYPVIEVVELAREAWNAALASHQPADDSWIEWKGGECPVKLSVIVEVRHRSEKWSNSRMTASVADWRHKLWCADTDIIAYRVVKP